jgi:hypothetical protein
LTKLGLFAATALLCALASTAFGLPIHDMAAKGDVAAAEVLLKSNPALANARDRSGAAPLHWAADRGRKAMVELLLANEADLNAAKSDGVTALHVASALGRKDIVELLLDKGANVNCKDHLGRTPYALARQRHHAEIADLLAARGALTVVVPVKRAGRAVTYRQMTVSGVALNVITVDTFDPRVRLAAATAASGIGGTESFGSFIRRLQPTAAINGTFFSKADFKPVGDIVVGGKLRNFGGMGTGLCITPDCKVSFVTANYQRHTDWVGFETVICSGPKLMRDGKIEIDTRGHKDPHVLGRGVRVAVGKNASGKLMLVATHIACSLTEIAGIMRNLGCTDAVNFDGGASVGMYCDGRMIRSPGRALTNVLLVYESKSSASAK